MREFCERILAMSRKRIYRFLAAAAVAALFVSSCDTDAPGPGSFVDINTDMVFVEGGAFMMGCDGNIVDDCLAEELPRHQVSLDGFYIGKYEVTQALWREVTGDNPAHWTDFVDRDETIPVEMVSWDDAGAFISKLNSMTGKKYRLPTEAEWEYAARGGKNSGNYLYAGGDNIGDVAWYNGNAHTKTYSVGGKEPNGLGLYDMSGNVAEWVSDWLGPDYYANSPQRNPKGPPSGTYRIYRGGSWQDQPVAHRVFYRGLYYQNRKNNWIGLRLAHPL
ncbi:MAG: formylglycine-generating enzyme family protein [Chitinispirillales bacterium]|jgi:formylglycine-generating enzyme required for sulfatase activity|nr:formylglycine-generating enzyme family protein [Chitinispirillales bacterium]